MLIKHMKESSSHLAITSVKFLNAVRIYHGKDKGVEVVNALQIILGREWSGQVLFDLIADNHREVGFIVVDVDSSCQSKINAIKAIRNTDNSLGLKEAKDLLDANIGCGPFRLHVRPIRSPSSTAETYEMECNDAIPAILNEFNYIGGVKAFRG
jgi:ribosomal protein L7/L12